MWKRTCRSLQPAASTLSSQAASSIGAGGNSGSTAAVRLPHLCRGIFQTSLLPNGLRLLTIDNQSLSSGIVFLSNGGPVYETDRNAGSSAVLQTLLYKGTQRVKQPQLTERLAPLGLALRIVNCREAFGWGITVPGYAREQGLRLLSDCISSVTNDEELFQACKQVAQQREAAPEMDATRNCFELMHQTAWGGKGLGRPELPNEEELQRLTMAEFQRYHAHMVQPDRGVLVISGVRDHDEAAAMVMGTMEFPARAEDDAESIFRAPLVSTYTGGIGHYHNVQTFNTVKKFEEKNLCHVALAFRGVTHGAPDFMATALIQTVLGGGTAFSTGGPGKGVMTKLYRDVVWRNAWIEGMECVTAGYRDNGLVALYGQTAHENTRRLIEIMFKTAASIATGIGTKELEMAKNQLCSQMILLAEPRDIMVEDCAKNLLLHNTVVLQEDLLRQTSQVTLQQFRDACARLVDSTVNGNPTYCVFGDTTDIPFRVDMLSMMAKHCPAQYAANTTGAAPPPPADPASVAAAEAELKADEAKALVKLNQSLAAAFRRFGPK